MMFIFRLNAMERLGCHLGKKKKYLTIETYTGAFSIYMYASVLGQGNKGNRDLPEDLAIYMDLVRSLQKDGSDWYNYDVTFLKAKHANMSLSWRQVDQVLYSRALMKKLHGAHPLQSIPFGASPFADFALNSTKETLVPQIVSMSTSVLHALSHTQKSNAGEAKMTNHPSPINPLHQKQTSHHV